jgi:hypothetical protein
VLEIELIDLNSLTFVSGSIMYIDGATKNIMQIKMCGEREIFDGVSCKTCPSSYGTLWIQQSNCLSCYDMV